MPGFEGAWRGLARQAGSIRAAPRRWVGLALAVLALGGCSPQGIRSEAPFTLLYSTVGYDARGTKRALVRGLGDAPDLDPERSRWQLVDAGGEVLEAGGLRPRGVTFGAPLWEIDFSGTRRSGSQLRLRVSLAGGAGGPGSAATTLESLSFPVESSLFSNRMALGLSLLNAELRRAPASMGGGYYDCNTKMGEAHSHAMFAVGLIELERRRGDRLEARERARLRDEIHRSIDYVLSLHDETSGEIANQHPSRPGGNQGDFNTQGGVYGLAHYLALGSEADPARSAEIERRVRTSLGYLERRKALYPALGAAVWARLYLYTGSPRDLEAALRHVEALVSGLELRKHFRHPQRSVPWFEGMALLSPVVDSARRQRWTDRAREWGRAFVDVAARNGYGVVPPLGPAEWDAAASVPVSPVEHGFYANAYFLTTSIDALLLAELTGDRRLERVAAASLQWVMGVNPGLPAVEVTGPPASPDEPSLVAAAFVVNAPGRHVRSWRREEAARHIDADSLWWWQAFAGADAQTVVSGFLALPRRGLVYDTSDWPSSETWIHTDGLLLRAALHYEDRLAAWGG